MKDNRERSHAISESEEKRKRRLRAIFAQSNIRQRLFDDEPDNVDDISEARQIVECLGQNGTVAGVDAHCSFMATPINRCGVVVKSRNSLSFALFVDNLKNWSSQRKIEYDGQAQFAAKRTRRMRTDRKHEKFRIVSAERLSSSPAFVPQTAMAQAEPTRCTKLADGRPVEVLVLILKTEIAIVSTQTGELIAVLSEGHPLGSVPVPVFNCPEEECDSVVCTCLRTFGVEHWGELAWD